MPKETQQPRIDTDLDAHAVSGLEATSAEAGSTHSNWRVDVASEVQAPEHRTVSDESSTPSTAVFLPKDQPVPSQLGRYRLESMLGRGGMGVVWLAYDPQLNRRVAIKTVRPDADLGSVGVAQFLDEGRRLAGLNHPNIIPIYDCGNDGGVCYLVAEYVPGGTLADHFKDNTLTHAQAAELVERIAEAAHYAHLRGLVHRDIKPANILMRESGKPLLADFGLAIAEEDQLRECPGTLGTYAYMAPEQMLGKSRFVDGRADIYSLGVVLYQLLTGRLPYLARTPEEYRELALSRDPRPPRSVRDDIPRELEAICLKCLARQPAERYSTAADLAAALRKPEHASVFHRWWLWAGTAAVLVLSGALAIPRLLDRTPRFVAGTEGELRPKNEEPIPEIKVPLEAPPRVRDDKVLNVSEVQLGDKSKTQWGIKDDGESLWFLSDDLCLFELGEYQGGDLKFSVDLEQKSWIGGLGVFWAYRPCSDQEGWRQLESMQLHQRGQGLQLRDATLSFCKAQSQWSRAAQIGVFKLDSVSGRRHRIGFEFRDGRLVRLEWDALDLSPLLAVRESHFSDGELNHGSFGLINVRNHGAYVRPMVNGRRVGFAVADDLDPHD